VECFCVEHDVNKFLYTGWTPLLYATSSVELEIVEYLLAHGANPNKHKGMDRCYSLFLSFIKYF